MKVTVSGLAFRPMYMDASSLLLLAYCGWTIRDSIATNSTLRYQYGFGAGAGCVAGVGAVAAVGMADVVTTGGCGGIK